MSPEISTSVKKERSSAPHKVLKLLMENFGYPISGSDIAKVVWNEEKDIQSILVLINRSRDYLRARNIEDHSIYNIFWTSKYVLLDKRTIGSWVLLPYEADKAMDLMSQKDKDFLHELHVRDDRSLAGRLKQSQYKLLSFLCAFSVQNKNDFISCKKIAKKIIGYDDYHDTEVIRVAISHLRNRMKPLESICLEGTMDKGYRVVRK